MNVIWRKIWRDIWRNKLRTLLVVLSTAVGVFALGLVFALSTLMRAQMTSTYQNSSPAHISFFGGQYPQDMIEIIARDPAIAQAEGEIRSTLRWKFEGDNEWQNGEIIARSDYQAQPMNFLSRIQGNWPEDREFVVEEQSVQYFEIPPGTIIQIEARGRVRQLVVQGVARSATVTPPRFGGNANFYTTPNTMIWLNDMSVNNWLNLRLTSYSPETAEEIAAKVEKRLENSELPPGGYTITDPTKHPLQEMIDTMAIILAVLGSLSLLLSSFLIINTLNAIIAQQIWQIGVMKAMGATAGHVVRTYLWNAFIYGILSILIAVPFGVYSAHYLAAFLLDLVNIQNGPFQIVSAAVKVQIAVGLLVPIAAAFVPVLGGARITPHQAIQNYGLGGKFGHGWLDRLIGQVRHLPRTLTFSLRNLFRRKLRMTLTLLTLAFGGVMFIVVMSVSASLDRTLEVLIQDMGLDVWAVLKQPYRANRLISITEDFPGIEKVEVWDQRPATLSLSGGEQIQIFLMGLPPDSVLFKPRIVDGRGLLPADEHAIVLNKKIAVEEGIEVGDKIELTIENRESTWTVVGLILNISDEQRNGFVPFDTFSRETGDVNQGTMVMVLADQAGSADEQTLIRNLRELYIRHNIETAFFMSANQAREQNRLQFDIITYLMLSMAILAAIVGSIGLMGTMSINVIERSKEIGVMRAIGATALAIIIIFVGEGVLLGLLSWMIAVPLSYPGAQIFSTVVGAALMNAALDFKYSLNGVILWLGIVVMISAVSSFWPALHALKISVREALVYE